MPEPNQTPWIIVRRNGETEIYDANYNEVVFSTEWDRIVAAVNAMAEMDEAHHRPRPQTSPALWSASVLVDFFKIKVDYEKAVEQ